MTIPFALFEEIYRVHGHRCPMSTLGGRIGYAARRHLSASAVGDLLGIYHARTCAVDGIVLAAGGLKRDESLFVREEGRHLLLLADNEARNGVRVSLRQETLDLAGEFRLRASAIEKSMESAPESERAALAAERERALDRLLETLWTAPDDDLLEIAPLYDLPLTLTGGARGA